MAAARAGGSPNWRLMPWLAACPASLRAPFCWPIRAHTNYSLTQNDGGNDRCFLPFQAYPDAYGDKPGHDGEAGFIQGGSATAGRCGTRNDNLH